MRFHPQPLFFVVLGLIVGTLPPVFASPFLLAGLALGALLGVLAIARPSRVPLAAIIAAAAAAGGGLAGAERTGYEHAALPEKLRAVAGAVILEGTVARAPRTVDGEIRFDLDASRIVIEGEAVPYGGRIRIFVRNAAEQVPAPPGFGPGSQIRAWVSLRRPEPVRTPGGFDQLSWARREGLHGFASCKSLKLIEVTRRSESGPTPLERLRATLERSWRHVPGTLDRAVTASMVLGDDGALDAATREEFRSAGLLHILVVSGSQVAALILGLRRLMPAALRISWPGCLVECLTLLVYCLLTGAENSIVRATVMAMAFAVAVRIDLERGGLNFLAVSALALLAARPLDAVDPGAQLSFAATLALIAYAGSAGRRLESRGLPGFVADIVAASVVATLAVSPLTLIHFHRLSLIALPANLLAAPLAVLLLYGSLTTAALDAVFAPAASWCGAACGLVAEALRSLAHWGAALDPDWRGPGPPLPMLLGLAGLASGVRWHRGALPFAGLLASLTASGLPAGDGRLHLWFLDVGQGDALVVETPEGRAGIIDSGPAFEDYDAGERVVGEALWALGHRRLDFMALSHRHADHDGGAAFLARHFAPVHVYLNGPSASMEGYPSRIAGRGDLWVMGRVRFRVLGPDKDWPLPPGDENGRSLVIEVRYGETSLLLLGDASKQAEGLLRLPGGGYDLVKTAHHGADTSSSEALVSATAPRWAVVSVGFRNRFSHPSPAVLDRWSRRGAFLWRTDRDRTLHVVSDGRTLRQEPW